MSDREALVAEFAAYDNAEARDEWGEMETAARERLAQLPEKCGNCFPTDGNGDGIEHDHDGTPLGVCHVCHGKGFLYPSALVERIAKVLCRYPLDPGHNFECRDHAVAVLDALNTEPVPDRNTKGTW